MPSERDAPRGSYEEVSFFWATTTKLAIFRLQARLERLEDSFLTQNPMHVLPEILETEEEREFKVWAKDRGLL